MEWLGRISDSELAQRLRTATLFCAPSLHGESFGVVLLEAMAAGTPVVASDISGYRDVARHDKEAVLVPGGDAAALADGLRRVLDDPTLAGRLVEAGYSPRRQLLHGPSRRPLRRPLRKPAGPNLVAGWQDETFT